MHYNRAIELNPNLPEPYMYRGVLYVQMGNKSLALKDHEKLLAMGSPLADELEYVVANGREKEPEQFFGVSPKMK
jgi:regulator of sirC expression with transglutaminase-like and TPR domain